jgi:hypothetical protein
VLGNSPQAKADGRQIVGRRLPLLSRGPIGWKTGAGRFPQWTIDGAGFEIGFVTADPVLISQRRHVGDGDDQLLLMIPGLERKLLDPDIGKMHGAKQVWP